MNANFAAGNEEAVHIPPFHPVTGHNDPRYPLPFHPANVAIHNALTVDKVEVRMLRRFSAVLHDEAVIALPPEEKVPHVAWALRDLDRLPALSDAIALYRGQHIVGQYPHAYARQAVLAVADLTTNETKLAVALDSARFPHEPFQIVHRRLAKIMLPQANSDRKGARSISNPQDAERIAWTLQLPEAAAQAVARIHEGEQRTQIWWEAKAEDAPILALRPQGGMPRLESHIEVHELTPEELEQARVAEEEKARVAEAALSAEQALRAARRKAYNPDVRLAPETDVHKSAENTMPEPCGDVQEASSSQQETPSSSQFTAEQREARRRYNPQVVVQEDPEIIRQRRVKAELEQRADQARRAAEAQQAHRRAATEAAQERARAAAARRAGYNADVRIAKEPTASKTLTGMLQGAVGKFADLVTGGHAHDIGSSSENAPETVNNPQAYPVEAMQVEELRRTQEALRHAEHAKADALALAHENHSRQIVAEQRARDAEAQLQHLQRQNAAAQAGRVAYGSRWVQKDGRWQKERFQAN